ncbi:hypothetical protein CPB84DRAFT_1773954 [Gymnopilus junonius]|uniref:Uncharacterized protein n=1 Tax=Gymnopilus junonius TaxID=109634 RepID=A0A9P5NR70_GYMJU|nr:hypothetical protein CPB84DRAFT_1773954 [Gymnopilus junonius]
MRFSFSAVVAAFLSSTAGAVPSISPLKSSKEILKARYYKDAVYERGQYARAAERREPVQRSYRIRRQAHTSDL